MCLERTYERHAHVMVEARKHSMTSKFITHPSSSHSTLVLARAGGIMTAEGTPRGGTSLDVPNAGDDNHRVFKKLTPVETPVEMAERQHLNLCFNYDEQLSKGTSASTCSS